jgi:RNA polymerase sigma-70 factor (ECF subfamily)
LFQFLLRMTLGDRREAEDLLQETLLRAWRYMQDHAANAQSLRPWLFTVARHLSIDASRARRSRPTEVIVGDLNVLYDARDQVDQMLTALSVRRGLQALNADQRRVIVEVYYYGRSAREAAEVIGIPVGTVKSRLFYALKALVAVTTDATAMWPDVLGTTVRAGVITRCGRRKSMCSRPPSLPGGRGGGLGPRCGGLSSGPTSAAAPRRGRRTGVIKR